MSKNVSQAELDFQLRQLHGSRKQELEIEANDRESARVQRYMDKEINSTRKELTDIVATTTTNSPNRQMVPSITLSVSRKNNESSGYYSHYQEGSNLKIKTKHNLQLSEKLSDNIRHLEERRRSRSLSPADVSAVSSQSLQNLYIAANVLRDTQHGAEAQKLLEAVTSRGKHS